MLLYKGQGALLDNKWGSSQHFQTKLIHCSSFLLLIDWSVFCPADVTTLSKLINHPLSYLQKCMLDSSYTVKMMCFWYKCCSSNKLSQRESNQSRRWTNFGTDDQMEKVNTGWLMKQSLYNHKPNCVKLQALGTSVRKRRLRFDPAQ